MKDYGVRDVASGFKACCKEEEGIGIYGQYAMI